MNNVMKLVKSGDLKVLDQQFDNVCSMTVQTDADKMQLLQERILSIDGTSIEDGA